VHGGARYNLTSRQVQRARKGLLFSGSLKHFFTSEKPSGSDGLASRREADEPEVGRYTSGV
jgi:hypothetical protein